MTEKLSVPEILTIAQLGRRPTKILPKSLAQSSIEASWPSRSWRLLQSRKPTLLKTTHPVLDGPGALTKKLPHFRTTESATDQKNPMKPVVIPGLLGSQDLVLDCELNDFCILDFQFAHRSLPPITMISEGSNMRNYL
jgi:hypothetical protein